MFNDQDKQSNQESVPGAAEEERAGRPVQGEAIEASLPEGDSQQAPDASGVQTTAPKMQVLTGIVSAHGDDEALSAPRDWRAESESNDDAASSADPFEDNSEEVPDAEEVAARDEKESTAPAMLRSSVQIAMDQRPPRRAKLNDGPRSRMLAELIPEVIIPTNGLETREFSKIVVTEGSAESAQEAQGQNEGTIDEAQAAGEAAVEEVSLEELIDRIDGKIPLQPSAGDSSEETADLSKRPSVTKRKAGLKKPKMTLLRIAIFIALCVLALIMAAGGLFAWDYWYRYDDAKDMLGEWKMTNAERTMVFTEAVMKIDDDVNYTYELDTTEKTITYSFGDSEGTASYRFSPDRQTLIIDETGKGVDWLVALHLKDDPVLDDRDVPEGITKLQKVSGDTNADPQDTEEVISNDDDYWYGGTFLGTYNEFKKPSLKDSDDDDEKKKSGQGADADDDSDEDEDDPNDDGAAYVDEATGNRYYYDSSQMLYYDQYGNYYYDMYGNNPYEVYTEEVQY